MVGDPNTDKSLYPRSSAMMCTKFGRALTPTPTDKRRVEPHHITNSVNNAISNATRGNTQTARIDHYEHDMRNVWTK